jgi:hypothetical protein
VDVVKDVVTGLHLSDRQLCSQIVNDRRRRNCRSAETAADYSGQRIPNRAQTLFFHRGSGNISADGTANQLNDQACDIHNLPFFLCLFGIARETACQEYPCAFMGL